MLPTLAVPVLVLLPQPELQAESAGVLEEVKREAQRLLEPLQTRFREVRPMFRAEKEPKQTVLRRRKE